jgi:uncharacterized PurR-regulated membrane protein YhhQ (DUF165 family)
MHAGVQKVEASALHGRTLRYFDIVMAAFVVILLLSNVLGAGKVAEVDLPFVGLWPFGAGILFFPLGYVIGDILTEVYGYARARRCIWAERPPCCSWRSWRGWWSHCRRRPAGPGRGPMSRCSARVPRIVMASIIAFWTGEFVNSLVLARMKVWTAGKHLWARTIGSTIAGQGVDSLIFYPLAFWGAAGVE